MTELNIPSSVTNEELIRWVTDAVELCKPDSVHWCDGSQEEYDRMCQEMVDAGTFIKLNEEKRPNSFLARSHPSDVARVEDRTYICSLAKGDAGPTNNWMAPLEMKAILKKKFDGCMQGRTMYVVPFCMGPIGSPISQFGVQLTDSAYAAVNMKIMTRMGTQALEALGRRRIYTLSALGRNASRRRPSRTSRGLARPIRKINTSFIFPRKIRSFRTVRVTAATLCWARNAWLCVSLRTSDAPRAGSPSTCSSSA